MRKKKRNLEGWEHHAIKEGKEYTRGISIQEIYIQERIMDERLTVNNEWRP